MKLSDIIARNFGRNDKRTNLVDEIEKPYQVDRGVLIAVSVIIAAVFIIFAVVSLIEVKSLI